MAVEILILSGARQGERVELDVAEFRAGDRPACELFFDSQRDAGAKDRSVVFRLSDDGWYVKGTGAGEVFVNQQPLKRELRIRSGDVVRMSELGPDFSFGIIARASKAAAASPGGVPALPPTTSAAAPTLHDSPSELVVPPPSAPVVGADSLAPATGFDSPAGPVASGDTLRAGPRSAASDELQKRAFWLAGGLAACIAFALLFVCVLLFVLVSFLVSRKDESTAVPPPAAASQSEGSPQAEDDPVDDPDPQQQHPDLSGTGAPAPDAPRGDSPQQQETPQTPPPPPPDPWEAAFAQLEGAIFLLEVECAAAEKTWPIATCCAIGEDTLLCSAGVACELMNFRRLGAETKPDPVEYTFWATNRSSGRRIALAEEIRVHVRHARAGGDLVEQLFFSFAVLKVRDKLSTVAPLASEEDWREIDQGYPVGFLGIGHDSEPITKFSELETELARGKIYLISTLDDSPDSPRLLQVTPAVPQNARGCPLINAGGKVVGVYTGSVPFPGAADQMIHYAAAVEPGLMETWLQERNTAIWVPPVIP